MSKAQLLRGSGITELVDLSPVAVHLVKSGANGFKPLAAKALDEPGRTTRPVRRKAPKAVLLGP